MKIKRTYNVKEAEVILKHPTIWNAIAKKSQDISSFSLEDKRKNIYLIGYVKNKPIGLYIVSPNLRKEYYCHIHVLPKYRKEYTNKFSKRVVQWIWENTSITTIYALVAPKYRSVLRVAKEVGFKSIDYKPNKKRDNNRWLLQINRAS